MWVRVSLGGSYLIKTCSDTMTYDKATRVLKLKNGNNESVHLLSGSEVFNMYEICR
jgi:hypothetical protein